MRVSTLLSALRYTNTSDEGFAFGSSVYGHPWMLYIRYPPKKRLSFDPYSWTVAPALRLFLEHSAGRHLILHRRTQLKKGWRRPSLSEMRHSSVGNAFTLESHCMHLWYISSSRPDSGWNFFKNVQFWYKNITLSAVLLYIIICFLFKFWKALNVFRFFNMPSYASLLSLNFLRKLCLVHNCLTFFPCPTGAFSSVCR